MKKQKRQERLIGPKTVKRTDDWHYHAAVRTVRFSISCRLMMFRRICPASESRKIILKTDQKERVRKTMKGMKKTCSKILSLVLTAAVLATGLPQIPAMEAQAASTDALAVADSAKATGNVVEVSFNGGELKGKITFLEDGIFRYNVDPSGEFSEYAAKVYGEDVQPAKIPQYPDSSDNYSHPAATVSEADGSIVITSGNTKIKFEKATAKMSVEFNGKTVMEESKALVFGDQPTQSLVKHDGENFFGGGTQNGRFIHTGEEIKVECQSRWLDGDVSSPSPFYYSSNGYGVLRNTFFPGAYDFGKTDASTVTAAHVSKFRNKTDGDFDAYYFLSDGATYREVVQDILDEYYHVTGNPALLPEYAFYEGHLNALNRDAWSETSGTKAWPIKGSNPASGNETLTTYYESGMAGGYVLPEGAQAESLNGENEVLTTGLDKYPAGVTTPYKFSASGLMDQYLAMDMPIGYFLPNDGYGTGYGKNGYYMTGGVNADGSSSAERVAAIDANVQNLKKFTEYAQSRGLETGLWTQSDLVPDSNPNTAWHILRDFKKEVEVGGITTLKTDVAWVGKGYDMALNSTKTGYDTVTGVGKRPNIITCDGWAGTQRFAAVWTGDQAGGDWEYIRYHIPTYIGQSLSGNPNTGSDVDGIHGGSALISTRDTQWKVFSSIMMNMDGWGLYSKVSYAHGDPLTGINRMYLKLKAQLLPYIYTSAASAANIDTGNDDTGLPMTRAMFLEYPDDAYAKTKAMQYQYMYGKNLLVAPVYTQTDKFNEETYDDVRNGIYLPDEDQVWIDYFTGKQYNGGQSLNNFDAPIWKLPLFVKNGAIIPMWQENNNPKGIDKSNRIAEFWPAGTTEYTLYEDDGKTVTNTTEEVEGYGVVGNIDYGPHVSTKYTSVVEGTTATLTAEKSTGTYNGYDQNKNTTFVVNVSKEPANVTAKNGNTTLTKVEKDSKDAVLSAELNAGEFAYYYDAAPAIETYAKEGETVFAEMMADKVSSPKLYVKFAETDSQANAQVLTIEGFENKDPDLTENKLNPDLAAPENLKDDEARKTPTSNTLTWDAVTGATSYEILVDGVVNSVGDKLEFTHTDQAYHSTHTYQVRARNEQGYSEWSEEIEATTALDPWRNVPTPESITWTGGDNWGALDNLTNHNFGDMFHSTGDVVTDAVPMIFDYGKAYKLDKLEYYARNDNYGNGTVNQLDVYTSLDGVNWTKQHDGASDPWSYNPAGTIEENIKTINFGGVGARYVKLVVTKSAGNFFSAAEIAIYKQDGTNGFAVGSVWGTEEVTENDYNNMLQYLALSEADTDFAGQVKAHNVDINNNNVYEVYDYAFTMFKMNGGTEKTGKVSGNIILLPSATEVKAGETFNVDVYANNVKNLNAFGGVLGYNPDKLEYVSISADFDVSQMENLTKNKIHNDGSADVNVAFANKGNQETYSGTGVIATITMKAKEDVTISNDVMDLSQAMLIGPEYDLIVSENSAEPTFPDITTGESENYIYGTDFNMTITNDELPDDDGTNVEKLIQNSKYDGLFDKAFGRDFEFKWDVESNYKPVTEKVSPVTMPLTLHMALNEEKAVESVKVYNANKANGYLTDATVVFTYNDDSVSDPINVALTDLADGEDVLEFANSSDLTVKNIDITFNKAMDYGTTESLIHLTLAEIEVMSEGSVLGQNAFALTMTNEYLTADSEGTNVSKLIQSDSYDGLFDGNKGRDFEFKWSPDDEQWMIDVPTGETALPSYIKVPVTLHANMTGAKAVETVTLYNANKGNGFATSATAVFNYEDGTASEGETIDIPWDTAQGNEAFTFTNPDISKKVTRVDLTVNTVTKSGGAEVDNMLTLAELELASPATFVPVESIEAAPENETELFVGSMADVNAVLTPEDASNPYFIASSSDETIVRIVTLTDENGLPIYKAYAVGKGEATITLTTLESKDDETPVTATYKLTVKAGADKTELVKMIEECTSINKSFYTEESAKALQDAIDAANAVKGDDKATKEQVTQAINAMKAAKEGLVEAPVTEITIGNGKENFTVDALYSEENYSEYLIDGDDATRWESPYYGADKGLPKNLDFDLGEAYDLDKVEIVKYMEQMNGRVTKYEVLVSTDGGNNYVSMGVKETDKAEEVSGIRFAVKGVTNVRVILHEALNSDGSEGADYADLTEVKFYGTKSGESVDKTALEKVINQYKDLTQDKWTDETWKAFTDALAVAQAVFEAEDATQAEVDAALNALTTAHGNLTEADEPGPGPDEPSVNKDALNQAIKVNAGKNEKDYTAESWAAFQTAYAKAQKVAADSKATELDVSVALRELEQAAAALQKAPEIINPPTNNSGSSSSSSSSTGNSATGSTGSNAAGGSGTAANGGNASTGDSAQPLIYLVLIAAAVAGFVFFRKKKAE